MMPGPIIAPIIIGPIKSSTHKRISNQREAMISSHTPQWTLRASGPVPPPTALKARVTDLVISEGDTDRDLARLAVLVSTPSSPAPVTDQPQSREIMAKRLISATSPMAESTCQIPLRLSALS